MEWFEALGLLIGAILILMAIGMPVALAFLAANIIGAWFFMGGARGVTLMLNNGFGGLTNSSFTPALARGCSTRLTSCWAGCQGGLVT